MLVFVLFQVTILKLQLRGRMHSNLSCSGFVIDLVKQKSSFSVSDCSLKLINKWVSRTIKITLWNVIFKNFRFQLL